MKVQPEKSALNSEPRYSEFMMLTESFKGFLQEYFSAFLRKVLKVGIDTVYMRLDGNQCTYLT